MMLYAQVSEILRKECIYIMLRSLYSIALLKAKNKVLRPFNWLCRIIFCRQTQPLLKYKVPTWSARGSKLVARGALLSVARENFDFIAPFYATVVARIFNGVKPRDIPQVFKDKMRLAINLETAKTIGYQIPPNILKVADIMYDKIEVPQGTP